MPRNPGYQVLGQEKTVTAGLASATLPVAVVGILRDSALAGVVDADDDQGLHFAGLNRFIGLLAHLPGAAFDERGVGVEQVLAVLHVEDRVGAIRFVVVPRREIDDEVARAGQVAALKSAVQAKPWVPRVAGSS